MRVLLSLCLALFGCTKFPWSSKKRSEINRVEDVSTVTGEPAQAASKASAALGSIDEKFECGKRVPKAELEKIRQAFKERTGSSTRIIVTEGGGECLSLNIFTLRKSGGRWSYSAKDSEKTYAERSLSADEQKLVEKGLSALTLADIHPNGCKAIEVKCEASIMFLTDVSSATYRPAHSSGGTNAEGFVTNERHRAFVSLLESWKPGS